MFFFQYSNKSISYNDRDLVATSKSGYSRLPFSYVPGQMRYIIFPASPGSAPGLQNMHGPFFFNFQRATFRWEHMINIYWWKKRCYVQLNTWHKVRLCNGHRHYLSALDVETNCQLSIVNLSPRHFRSFCEMDREWIDIHSQRVSHFYVAFT